MALQSTVAEINLSKFRDNIKLIKSIVGNVKTVLVVKANAYSHGIVGISHAAIRFGIDCLAVATPNEGIKLRESGITSPILLLFQHSLIESDIICYYNLIPIITNTSNISRYEEFCKKYNKKLSLYLKVDTGLGRMGVKPFEVVDTVKDILSYKCFNFEGIATHFAAADFDDDTSIDYTNKQIKNLNTSIDLLKNENIEIKNIQAANSSASLYYKNSYYNMVRFGFAAYGYAPNEKKNPGLNPIMSLKSRIVVIKKLKKGESVSYGMTFTAQKDTRIAIIPLGYADGYPRCMSNKGKVKINGNYYNIRGRICMDTIMIDIGSSDTVNIGDEVLLFGDDELLNANTLAKEVETSPYEILTNISSRVDKYYIE